MLCSVTEDSSFAAAMAVSAAFSLSFSLSCAKSGAQKSIEHASAQEIAKRETGSSETTTVFSTPRLRLIHILLRVSNPGRQAAQFYAALGCKSKLPALRRFRFYALVAPFSSQAERGVRVPWSIPLRTSARGIRRWRALTRGKDPPKSNPLPIRAVQRLPWSCEPQSLVFLPPLPPEHLRARPRSQRTPLLASRGYSPRADTAPDAASHSGCRSPSQILAAQAALRLSAARLPATVYRRSPPPSGSPAGFGAARLRPAAPPRPQCPRFPSVLLYGLPRRGRHAAATRESSLCSAARAPVSPRILRRAYAPRPSASTPVPPPAWNPRALRPSQTTHPGTRSA